MEPASNVLPSLPAGASAVLLAADALQTPLDALLDALARALRGVDGVPVSRISCSLPMMHPEIRSTQLVWEPVGGARIITRTHGSRAMYQRSPMRPLYEGETRRIRHRIHPDDGPRPYEILDELAAAGFTDYLALVNLADTAYQRAPTSWATDAPGGFTDAQIGALEALVPLFGMVLTVHAQRNSTRALLGTYLGADAATRVLDGHIRRGDVVDIEAAVCFCDLRDFTALSQQLDQGALLDLLHDAFGAVVGAVEEERGDVLKFIGDAVLAVFRVDGGEPARRDAVARAFRAGQGALQRAEAIDRERRAAGKAPLRIGLSLHLGHVAYGNIGGPTRLDFTVIGAAVNLASRLEGMCRALGYPMVLSDAVASRLDEATGLVDAGAHTLKGIPEPVRVWGVRTGGYPPRG